MNTKVALGALAVVIIAVATFFVLNPMGPSVPTSPTVSSTTPATTASPTPPQQGAGDHSQPTFKMGAPVTTVAQASVRFDSGSFVSASANPVITGTANVSKVGMIVYDSKGAGIVGTGEIPVVEGHWSYAVSVALKPGTYTLTLFGGGMSVSSKLTITNP